MTQIRGVNNPGTGVHVDASGRLEAHAVASTEQSEESRLGTAFNVNTGQLTLTDDSQTPVLYIKNNGSERVIKISRIFLTMLTSDGSGEVSAKVTKNPTGGTLLDEDDMDVGNFNFGSGRTISVSAKKGGTSFTVTGDTDTSIDMLFTGDSFRELIAFENIVLPRGASMVLYVTPPTGNTSVVVQAGVNLYLELGGD